MSLPKLGFIGIGLMGKPMTLRLQGDRLNIHHYFMRTGLWSGFNVN